MKRSDKVTLGWFAAELTGGLIANVLNRAPFRQGAESWLAVAVDFRRFVIVVLICTPFMFWYCRRRYPE